MLDTVSQRPDERHQIDTRADNANKSSTYKYLNSNYVSVYGFVNQSQSTGAKGDVATDTFTFGGTTVKNQQFDIAYGNSTISLSILGLGYASAESQVFTSPVQPPYDNFPLSLAKQGATNLALFSLWKNAVDSHDGEILFGGVDTAKYTGSLTTLETQNRTGENEILGFDVLLNGVALSGNSSFPKGSTGSVSAVLDCGTSYSILPDDWVQPIYDQFDITYFQDNDTAYVDCALETEKYTINYIFESLTIQVPISAMVVLRAINPYICSFGLVPAGTRLPLLGENFLSSSYAVFDLTNNQISLATRDFSSTTDNVIAVPAKGVKGIDSSGMNPSPSGTATGTGSGTTSGTGTATGSGASPTTSKKSSASSVTFSTCVVGISLLIILSLRSLF